MTLGTVQVTVYNPSGSTVYNPSGSREPSYVALQVLLGENFVVLSTA